MADFADLHTRRAVTDVLLRFKTGEITLEDGLWALGFGTDATDKRLRGRRAVADLFAGLDPKAPKRRSPRFLAKPKG